MRDLDKSKRLDVNKLDADEMLQELKKRTTGTRYESIIRSESFFKKRYDEFKKNRGFAGICGLDNLVTQSEMVNKVVPMEYIQYKDEINAKKAEISQYENILKHQYSLLEANLEIPSMKRNLFLLFVFTLTGVFLPLLMMLLDYEFMIKGRIYVYLIMIGGWHLVISSLVKEFLDLISSLNDVID